MKDSILKDERHESKVNQSCPPLSQLLKNIKLSHLHVNEIIRNKYLVEGSSTFKINHIIRTLSEGFVALGCISYCSPKL